ncbi:nucleoside hydrolase [Chloroflexi bacterium]|nr:nucleoside hydrolase [Chloroflexota bacterium]
MNKNKIILDTDPGNDDLLAIIMALKSELLYIHGLTIVGGNASIEDTTDNALSLLTYLDRTEVPVYVGDPSALNEILISTEEFEEFKSHRIEIHGETGLHIKLPTASIAPQEIHAVDFIISEAEANKGELILVSVGPLTNIALALEKEPRLIDWIKSIHVMGGAIDVPGNVTEYAEFNIYCDPEAANTVLSSGIDVKLCGLDITRVTSVKQDETEWLRGNSPGEKLIRQLLDTVFENTGRNSFSLHDPITVLSVLYPELIDWKAYDVLVICEGSQFGRTVPTLNPNGFVSVGIRIDQEKAKAKIAEILAS